MVSAAVQQAEPEDELNRAIEELRGVLHENNAGPQPGAPNAAATSAAFSSSGTSNIIMSIPVEVQVVLGRAEMPVSELMSLQKGSTVSLDRRIGEPIDVVVNGRKIARGEIIVLENDPSRFGIRLTQILAGGKNS